MCVNLQDKWKLLVTDVLQDKCNIEIFLSPGCVICIALYSILFLKALPPVYGQKKLLTLKVPITTAAGIQAINFSPSLPIFEKVCFEISWEVSASRHSHEISCHFCYFWKQQNLKFSSAAISILANKTSINPYHGMLNSFICFTPPASWSC